ncbi:Uncharacterized protein HZ326_17300, partial [Fusarium oxysporum f. sp. albedinis]
MSSDKKKEPFWLGGAAACMAVCFTHPLDQTKYRMQVLKSNASMLNVLYRFAARDGIPSLWNGLSASILRQGTYSTARFGFHTYQAFYPYATNPRFSSGDVQERMARKRKTTANTWAHAREPLNSEPSRCGRKNEKIYYCMHCVSPTYSTTVSTTFRNHLLKIHGIELEAHEHPIK